MTDPKIHVVTRVDYFTSRDRVERRKLLSMEKNELLRRGTDFARQAVESDRKEQHFEAFELYVKSVECLNLYAEQVGKDPRVRSSPSPRSDVYISSAYPPSAFR